MTMFPLLITVLALTVLIDVLYCPRLEKTDVGDIILFYNNIDGSRGYLILYKHKK